ncbi:MAG TPA: DUF1684 domain-containing protein [Thermoanaerobaculia bacterium]|nr:DUF1684 domain-containing protein [Thermoanaerobaculia bacterium]
MTVSRLARVLRRRAAAGIPVLCAVAVLAACQNEPAPPPEPEASFDEAAWREEVEAWHAERIERLRSEDGWLSLVGLHWLPEGDSRLGSEPMADVVLPPSAPATVGTLTRQGQTVSLDLAPGVEATAGGEPLPGGPLASDAGDAGPTVVQIDGLRLQVLDRDGRMALRVKDAASPTRQEFTGIERYPVDPAWRVVGRLEPYETPKQIEVDDVTGGKQQGTVPGALVVELGGETHRLEPLGEGDALFLIFADETNGDGTYGAGRYLYTELPGPDGRVVVDFNRAYNPPCAFTPYATCPLPPPQNRLPVAVTAGEKDYHGPGAHPAGTRE